MGGTAGRPPRMGLLPLSLLLLLLLLPALPMETADEPRLRRLPVIFNFGDSNSDTGASPPASAYSSRSRRVALSSTAPPAASATAASSSISCVSDPHLPLPSSATFSAQSTSKEDESNRCALPGESLNSSYLSPYMESLGSDFRNGANFAVIGSCTRPPNVPFSLAIQVQQFLRFKLRSLELVAQGTKGLIDAEGFQNALYAIDIGQNDLAAAFSANLTYAKVIGKIPSVIHEIKKAIKNLYDNGGKNFWVHNTGPLGCLPQKLALPRKNDSSLDPYGCLIPFNNAAKEFNAQLSALCDELNSKLKNATIVYTDIYSIKYDLIANFTKYSFETALMACCGYGGPPYNFNQRMECGSFGSKVCPLGSKYISWDGVHYTEAANAIVASKILTTKYSKPNLAVDYFCTA